MIHFDKGSFKAVVKYGKPYPSLQRESGYELSVTMNTSERSALRPWWQRSVVSGSGPVHTACRIWA